MDDGTVRCGQQGQKRLQQLYWRDAVVAAGRCVVRQNGQAECYRNECLVHEEQLDGADRLWFFAGPHVYCGRVGETLSCTEPRSRGRGSVGDHARGARSGETINAAELKRLNRERDVVDVAMDRHAMAVLLVKSDGSLTVFKDAFKNYVPSPMPTGVAALGVGDDTACVLLKDGRVACWGAPNLASGRKAHVLTYVAGIDDATQLAMERDMACALRKSGAVTCWRTSGQNELKPWPVDSPGNVTHLTLMRGLCLIGGADALWCGPPHGPSKLAPYRLYAD